MKKHAHSIESAMAAAKPTVLVIDDEVSNIDVINRILESDYEVIFAKQGLNGIDVAQEALPDVILLDIVMPGIDGYEVCLRLKKDPRTAAIPIIFITGLDTAEQEVRGFEVGAIDYMTKPLMPPVVQARVRSQLAHRRKICEPLLLKQIAVDEKHEDLSQRQREILEWVHAGKTNWEIARIIGSTEANVKYHMKKIMAKLGSYNRSQAAAKAVDLKLIALNQ